MAAAVAVLAQALGADPDLDGPVSQSWTMAVLVLLFLICDSTPTAVASRQSAWSPSSSVTLAAVVLVHLGSMLAYREWAMDAANEASLLFRSPMSVA